MNTECSILNEVSFQIFTEDILCSGIFLFYINLSCKLIIFMMLPQNGVVLFTGGKIECV